MRHADTGIVHDVIDHDGIRYLIDCGPHIGRVWLTNPEWQVVDEPADDWAPGACKAWANVPQPDVTVTMPHALAAAVVQGGVTGEAWTELKTCIRTALQAS